MVTHITTYFKSLSKILFKIPIDDPAAYIVESPIKLTSIHKNTSQTEWSCKSRAESEMNG